MGNPSADRKKQKEKRHKKMIKRLNEKDAAAAPVVAAPKK